MTQEKQKILLIGASGFLGSSLLKNLPSDQIMVEGVCRDRFDLAKPIFSFCEKYFEDHEYQYVIICAAMADVEKCFQQQKRSHQINVKGVQELLNFSRKCNATPVFFSSDYVFAGQGNLYREDDPREPNTVYGHQKLEIEKYLEKNFENFLIFRTSKLMSKDAHPKNILLPLLQSISESRPIYCFEDQWLNPVFVEDIAEVLKLAFQKKLRGTFHLGTERIFSRAELGRFLAVSLGCDPKLIQSSRMSDMNFSETRPRYNTLNCDKVKTQLCFRFHEVEDAIFDIQRMTSL